MGDPPVPLRGVGVTHCGPTRWGCSPASTPEYLMRPSRDGDDRGSVKCFCTRAGFVRESRVLPTASISLGLQSGGNHSGIRTRLSNLNCDVVTFPRL